MNTGSYFGVFVNKNDKVKNGNVSIIDIFSFVIEDVFPSEFGFHFKLDILLANEYRTFGYSRSCSEIIRCFSQL